MTPKSWSGGTLVVSMFYTEFFREVVDKDT